MRFYFDMDGVMTDFEQELSRRGWSRSDPDFEEKMTEQHKHGDFYLHIPNSERFDDLKRMICRLKGEGHYVGFLTSFGGRPAGQGGRVYYQKREWLDRAGFSVFPLMTVPVCENKRFFAVSFNGEEGRFLVDDQLQNVEGWREAGGLAFHYTSKNHNDLEFILGSLT